jgi:hypothetical protein
MLGIPFVLSAAGVQSGLRSCRLVGRLGIG